MTRKKKSSHANRPVRKIYGPKSYKKPTWMKIVRIISISLLVILMLLGMIKFATVYYHTVTKH